MTRPTLPPGFVEVRKNPQIWWVKEAWAAVLPELLATPEAIAQHSTPVTVSGGRGDMRRLPLADGGCAMIRQYQRGGFVRHFVRDQYWGRPFRPFTELHCTEEARRYNVPTIEALAAGVTKLGGGYYRGIFVSREAVGYVNLWEWLQQQPAPLARTAMLTAVAQAIRHMHDAGIFHADLNLTNLLVRADTTPPDVRIIDFDRGHVCAQPLSHSRREQNLRRLWRSWRKLDREGKFSVPADVETFDQAYGT